jgi:hypothetical protein
MLHLAAMKAGGTERPGRRFSNRRCGRRTPFPRKCIRTHAVHDSLLASQKNNAVTGATKNRLLNLSRIPPWPGIRSDESLTP